MDQTMDVRDTLLDWLVSPETAYLIGAGCRVCAGKPLIGKLTEEIVPNLAPDVQALFQRLNGAGAREATIEDLINHLLKRRDILLSLKSYEEELFTPEFIDESINIIHYLIVDKIKDNWTPVDYHMRFLRRVQMDRYSRDIFTLNYDTVLEASLEELRLSYADGFVGAVNAYFDPTDFANDQKNQIAFRLCKLHGSINWMRDNHDFVRRRPVDSIAKEGEPIVVYPSEQKYFQTQYGVYETLMGLFRERMRFGGVNNPLVCLGYSFNDDHINEAIVDAARQEGNNLSVYAFIGPEQYDGGNFADHQLRLQRLEVRCPSRFNAYVGSEFYLDNATDEEISMNVLKRELWRFENLVNFLAGEERS